MKDNSTNEVACRICGAVNPGQSTNCWMCDKDLSSAIELRTGSRFSFRLSSLILTTTLVAICLAIIRIAPGIGILLAVVSTPALVRTALEATRRRSRGRPMDIGDKVMAFINSLGVVVAIFVAAGVACWMTCTGTIFGGLMLEGILPSGNYGMINAAIVAGIGGGGLVALLVAVRVGKALWPFNHSQREFLEFDQLQSFDERWGEIHDSEDQEVKDDDKLEE